MTATAKYCPKCNKIFPPNSDLPNCPNDGSQLAELGTLINTVLDGKYVLSEELGSGGWGTVYLAKHQELGSRFAAKILSAELCQNMRHIERFKLESHMLARLEHPGIVKVIDCGLSPRPFIIMELAQGKLLSQTLSEKGRLSEREALEIAKKLAETLKYAHSLGIVHQDIKPSNIMVRNTESGIPELKLLDFGVAKLIDTDAIAENTGESFGSPEYMSPEQFSQHASVGAKADIYSMGCVLFECLTGHKPFKGKNYIEWSSVHRHVRPAFQDNEIGPGKLAKELASITLLCLSKEQKDRPSAEELLERLNIEQAGSAAYASRQAKVPGAKYLFSWTGDPKISIAISLGLLLSVGGLAALLMTAKRHEPPKSVQQVAEKNQEDLITSMSAETELNKVENSNLVVPAAGDAPELEISVFKPENVRGVILTFSPQKRVSKPLEPLMSSWAEHGYLVASAELPKKEFSTQTLAACVKSVLEKLCKSKEYGGDQAASFVLMCSGEDLDTTLSAAKLSSDNSSYSLPELSGVISIDPLASKTAPHPQEYHDASFPVFFLLDSEIDSKLRPSTLRRAETAFTFGSGKQVLVNSSRVSLTATPAYRDQQVFRALLLAFLDSCIKHDRAKEGYLYSQKSIMALNSVGELRFR